MGLKSAYEFETDNLDEVAVEEITAFLNRKKGEAFWALEKREGMSNKEWAVAANTTPTSLSNIVLKFENFHYKLINGESKGRKRCYYLTELAKEYVYLKERNEENDDKVSSVYQQEEWILGQQFKETLEKLKARNGEYYEAVIENILIRRIYGLEDVDKPEDRQLVYDLILVLETALEKEYDGTVDRCMKLLSPTAILSKRLEEYLECFYAFSPFYKKMQNAKEKNAVGRIFKTMILHGKTEMVETEMEELGLSEYGLKLEKVINQIKNYCHELMEEQVYEKLDQLMPVRKQMNYFLASWICYYNEKSKE